MRPLFLALIFACAAFVWFTGQQMPAQVVSHFGPGGAPNSFMPRGAYLAFMLTTIVLTPLLLASVGLLIRVLPASLVNLPHREYWLAPERREATIRSLTSPMRWMGAGLAIFLSFVHWLVVRANLRTDPELNTRAIGIAAIVLVAGALVWLVLLIVRFARVPGART